MLSHSYLCPLAFHILYKLLFIQRSLHGLVDMFYGFKFFVVDVQLGYHLNECFLNIFIHFVSLLRKGLRTRTIS
jgi:hypothetical protein